MPESSPRTRGCSHCRSGATAGGCVFPAHAGVFPIRPASPLRRSSLPRARGGVPLESETEYQSLKVFPAHAGVFPCGRRILGGFSRLPRARGGVPLPVSGVSTIRQSSPRTRGCSQAPISSFTTGGVFPAHAGVFPMQGYIILAPGGLPRARGGVPVADHERRLRTMSSPRTRGCSRCRVTSSLPPEVFPAHAGVFPQLTLKFAHLPSLPRARGGVPGGGFRHERGPMSSPRTRGCSRETGAERRKADVFPAHAGVFPHTGATNAQRDGLPRARGGVPSDTQPVEGTRLSVDFT